VAPEEDHLGHLEVYFKLMQSEIEQARDLLFTNWWAAGPAAVDAAIHDDDLDDRIREKIEAIEDVEEVFADDLDPEVVDALAEHVDVGAALHQVHDLDPAEAPLWSYSMMYRVEREPEWLLHCSDEAHRIASEGFRRGVEDIGRLGLTTYLPESWKDYPGYNFAFTIPDAARYAFERGGRCKYGRHMVLLKAPYVYVYHHGDSEPQAIFWGPDAREIVLVSEAYGSLVASLPSGEELEAGSIDELIDMLEELPEDELRPNTGYEIVGWVDQKEAEEILGAPIGGRR